ncbi:pyridoxal-phosphate dependent enzyme [Nocardia sp. NPDC020380]|uniref:pyridoxal-phosphate dependent enzyme n=1 Tax=Nocardia sp. NPDC020380 TaxID=3364309 RepID=UPI0037B8E256
MFADDGVVLECGNCTENSLLRSRYDLGEFRPLPGAGPTRYRNWLPIIRSVPSPNVTTVFPGHELGRALGLSNLWIAFTGYWPERDCYAESFSFKELEAITVLGRRPAGDTPLIVGSAGNTASALALWCTNMSVPCILVVPARQLERLALATPFGPSVEIIGLDSPRYSDALVHAETLRTRYGVPAEGGVRNVARRDGMATVVYSAFEALGRLPDYYVQAVGSASGALAAYEAALRLPGEPAPRLVLCQHADFAPVHRHWTDTWTDTLCPPNISTPELTTITPPYSQAGGIAEVLRRSRGSVEVASESERFVAAAVFEQTYGIDIEPPAAIALAGLKNAVDRKAVEPDALILLNITGGGRKHRMKGPDHVGRVRHSIVSGHTT